MPGHHAHFGEVAERKDRLAKLVSDISPFISPLIERYASEAVSEGFHAEYYFKEEQERCWWALSFLPTKGDKTLIDPISRGKLDFCAILRIHSEGSASFEIGVPTKFEKQFCRNDFVRVTNANEVSDQMVASWLDSFVAKSFEVASAHARP
jgi:hypothetical protein